MADRVIENLITQLTFKTDKDALKSFDKFLKSAAIGLTAIVGTATAAEAAIFSFTKSVAKINDEWGKFSQITGINLKLVQEFGFAAEIGGSSVDTMNAALSGLSSTISETSRGVGSGAEVFGILGVSVIDSAGKLKEVDEVMFELSDSLARLRTDAERLEFARKLGIDQSLLLILKDGSESLKTIIQQARELDFAIDEDAARAAAIFNDELVVQERLLTGIKSVVGTTLIKTYIPFIKTLNEWIIANRDLIKQNVLLVIQKIQKATQALFNIGVRVVAVVEKLAMSVGGWKNAIILATGALISMNAAALLTPILAVAAAAGLFLIIEDIQKFAEGGDSALGNLIERFPALETPVRLLVKLLGMIVEGWRLILTEGGNALEGMILLVKDLTNDVKVLGERLFNFLVKPLNLALVAFDKLTGSKNELIEPVKVDQETGAVNFLKGLARDQIAPLFDFANNLLGTNVDFSKFRTPGVALNAASPVLDFGSTINPRPQFGPLIPQANVQGGSRTVNNNNNTTNNTNNSKSNPNVIINVNGNNTKQMTDTILDILNRTYSGAVDNLSSEVGV